MARHIRANELSIADRMFCTLGFLGSIQEQGAHALIRLHKSLPFSEETPFSLAEEGGGRRVFEQKITVDGREYRRVRVELDKPTRDGDRYIDILTDLPPEIPAATVADLYRRRWKPLSSMSKSTSSPR